VLATYSESELPAVAHYFRSLACAQPFVVARENLLLLLEQNRELCAARRRRLCLYACCQSWRLTACWSLLAADDLVVSRPAQPAAAQFEFVFPG
jgi:hypothetical protein